MFDLARFEAFAMQTVQQPEIEARPGWIDARPVAAALMLSPEELHAFAIAMREEGWASVELADGPKMRLSIAGREAIRRMARPKWQRWAESHPLTMVIVTGIVYSVVSGVILYHLLKP